MPVQILSKTEDTLYLSLEDEDVAIANSLRRVILSEVPVLSIREVLFHENSSSLYDEIIAHRMGLVPIRTDPDLYNLREACSCGGKGCPSCTLILRLEKEGPGIVYSQDLVPEDPKAQPRENIPLLKLGKGQKLVLEAEAVLETAREHSKAQPAVVSYKYFPEIEITGKCTLCGACIERCPRKILSSKKNKLEVTDAKECILCNTCAEVCDYDAITARGNERKFLLSIESTGALECEEIFEKSCEIMEKKAAEMLSLL
jgi:DNA-directed RNA polymerase subunit D